MGLRVDGFRTDGPHGAVRRWGYAPIGLLADGASRRWGSANEAERRLGSAPLGLRADGAAHRWGYSLRKLSLGPFRGGHAERAEPSGVNPRMSIRGDRSKVTDPMAPSRGGASWQHRAEEAKPKGRAESAEPRAEVKCAKGPSRERRAGTTESRGAQPKALSPGGGEPRTPSRGGRRGGGALRWASGWRRADVAERRGGCRGGGGMMWPGLDVSEGRGGGVSRWASGWQSVKVADC